MAVEDQTYLAQEFLSAYDTIPEGDERLQEVYEGHIKKSVSLARGEELGDAIVKVLRQEGTEEVRHILDTLSGDEGRVMVAKDDQAENKVTYY